LTGLGQTLERKPDIKDVSATYNEKAVRYNSLLAEWQATGDANLKVPLDKADQALAKLTGLGQTLERKPDIKDVSATYNEKAVRYNSLLAEWQATGDANQKVLLEAEMNALKKQLDDLSRKAERQTIVLILEG
ncbi:hypothetical protein ACP3TI_13780, partial [Desulforudis sp. 1190]|uniref:hypothetical protein n=1 Tax=Desulforudis sp. 1190 TaxID=3416136 RepID=UPI003CED743F